MMSNSRSFMINRRNLSSMRMPSQVHHIRLQASNSYQNNQNPKNESPQNSTLTAKTSEMEKKGCKNTNLPISWSWYKGQSKAKKQGKEKRSCHGSSHCLFNWVGEEGYGWATLKAYLENPKRAPPSKHSPRFHGVSGNSNLYSFLGRRNGKGRSGEMEAFCFPVMQFDPKPFCILSLMTFIEYESVCMIWGVEI